MNEPLAEMLRYNRWATAQLLEACRPLSVEQLAHRFPQASGSLKELLLHLVGGQQTFALRTRGRQHEGEFTRTSAWPGIDALVESATRSSDALVAIAEALESDTSVALPFMGKSYRYPQSFFLVHALEHGVEHRTEIKLALASLGIPSPDLDAWQYAAAMGYGVEE